MLTPEKLPKDAETVLKKIANSPEEFEEFVMERFRHYSAQASFEPDFSKSLFTDAHHCYTEDIKRLPSGGDCFERCGCLAYWLRRNSPEMDWAEIKKHKSDLSKNEKEEREMVFQYGRQYHAFFLGYEICWNMKHKKQFTGINLSYAESVCRLMKYKSISPHAMGMIYRSLFFV